MKIHSWRLWHAHRAWRHASQVCAHDPDRHRIARDLVQIALECVYVSKMHSRAGGAANSGFVGRHATPDGNCFARGHNRAGAPREHAENWSKPLKICVFAVTEDTRLQPQQDSRLDGARWRYDGHTSHRKSKQSDLDDGKCVLTNRDSFPEASF